jgi:hypothetical protein
MFRNREEIIFYLFYHDQIIYNWTRITDLSLVDTVSDFTGIPYGVA